MSWIAASNWVLFSVSKSSIYLIVLLNFLANILLFLITFSYIYNNSRMKSTLKVHNPRVLILLICINDVQEKELSFQVCNI